VPPRSSDRQSVQQLDFVSVVRQRPLPPAVVGGEFGYEMGMAVITWLGLGFLALSIAEGLGEYVGRLSRAVSNSLGRRVTSKATRRETGGSVCGSTSECSRHPHTSHSARYSRYLLKKAAMNATRGAMTVGSNGTE